MSHITLNAIQSLTRSLVWAMTEECKVDISLPAEVFVRRLITGQYNVTVVDLRGTKFHFLLSHDLVCHGDTADTCRAITMVYLYSCPRVEGIVLAQATLCKHGLDVVCKITGERYGM